jgi:predicted HNH restriction endonuclease
MGKRLPTTPRSKVRQAIRQLWLRSRERATALKNAKYTCSVCGVKQSKAKGKEQKIEVHHREGIDNWDMIIDLIISKILCTPEDYDVVCPACHEKKHEK